MIVKVGRIVGVFRVSNVHLWCPEHLGGSSPSSLPHLRTRVTMFCRLCASLLPSLSASAGSVGRRQFVSFDSAQTASSVLGCEGEELHTAVFKHHLRQLLQRATGGSRERGATAQSEEGEGRPKARAHCGESNSQQKFNVVVCPHCCFYVRPLPSSSCHVMLTTPGSISSSSSSAFKE